MVSDLGVVWLIANVREADAGVLHRGAAISARFAAFPDRVFKGRIDFIAEQISTALPQVEAKHVKAIATLGLDRAPGLENHSGTSSTQI